jgi:hypothetical protein
MFSISRLSSVISCDKVNSAVPVNITWGNDRKSAQDEILTRS